MASGDRSWWARLSRLARLVIRTWALLGGVVLVALVVMTGTSAILNLLLNKPFPGDFEIVKHVGPLVTQ